MLRLIATLLLLALAGCALSGPRPGPPGDGPTFRLPPTALPGGMAQQQRLTFTRDGRRETVDALVEADASVVRVVVHMQGQVALRLAWDGKSLDQTRSERLPPQLTAGHVLSDLQLVFWPVADLSAALPPGWRLGEQAGRRTLLHGDEIIATVEQPAPDRRILRQLRHGYELQIESAAVEP